MKKRILCAILTLILLVSLVPTAAISVSAAGMSVSESAITVLKQLQGYHNVCNQGGYTGYGTPCETSVKKYGNHNPSKFLADGKTINPNRAKHEISETDADKALRKELAEIDKAVNAFASANGLALRQSQHDALVLFTFRNGTAWLSGTGDVKRAITTRVTGNDFLNMFCNWQTSTEDNTRRLIEANMYLNGAYSTAVPSKYVKITFEPGSVELPKRDKEGVVVTLSGSPVYSGKTAIAKMPANKTTFYFDVTLSETTLPIPSLGEHDGEYSFLGWYNEQKGIWVKQLDSFCNNYTLTAKWQLNTKSENESYKDVMSTVDYVLKSSSLASRSAYEEPNGEATGGSVNGDVKIDREYVDKNGVKWVRFITAEEYTDGDGNKIEKYKAKDAGGKYPAYWLKAGKITSGGVNSSDQTMDIMVTVTNSYVNSRVNASIYSAKNGSYSQGAKLRILTTAQGSGFLWGQVAKSNDDSTPVGWVALMYTDYESVMAGQSNNNMTTGDDKVIAKARIKAPVNGYVHVRSGAGTDNAIVGSLSYDTMVDLYEIKYVNSFQWGRYDGGWFALAYADVTRLVEETNETSQSGYTSYTFDGEIRDTTWLYESPAGKQISAAELKKLDKDKKDGEKLANGRYVVVTRITKDGEGNIWGKINQGWIMMFRKQDNGDYAADNFSMYSARYQVIADSATVRDTYNTSGKRVDTLAKGVEFKVTKLYVDDSTIWGYADKVGEADGDTYGGWVNLSSRYVQRNGAPVATTESSNNSSSSGNGNVATIKGADQVNVRSKASVYGDRVCQVNMGASYNVVEGPTNGWYRVSIPGYTDKETWIYQDYVDVRAGSVSSGSSSGSGTTGGKAETGKGIIANTYQGVNMRSSAGISGTFMGKILTGIAVDILEVKQVGPSKWGRVTVNGKTGWICMDYVTMITYDQIPGGNGSSGNGSNGSSGSAGNTVTGSQTKVYTGKVKEKALVSAGNMETDEVDTQANSEQKDTLAEVLASKGINADTFLYGRTGGESNDLIVFKSTDVESAHVRVLEAGDPVTVHEVLTVNEVYDLRGTEENKWDGELEEDVGGFSGTIQYTAYWARVNDGYIRSPGANIELDAEDEAVYTLVDYDKLYVYEDERLQEKVMIDLDDEDEDVTGTAALTIKKGDKVTVTKVQVVNGGTSGYVELSGGREGWIDLSRMTKGSVNVQTQTQTQAEATTPTTAPSEPILGSNGNTGSGGFVSNAGGYKYTGKVINTQELNVRASASTGASKTTVLKGGASLVIYETTIAEEMAWGRCDAGWVYLYYVDLTPASGSAMDARVVYNDNTIIYTDSSCSAVAGTYNRMAVIDIYEMVGNMVRTELGWVKTTDLL